MAVRYQLAKEHLDAAINKYDQFLENHHNPNFVSDQEILEMELQRSLVLLGHVALELRDGKTLQECTIKLFDLFKKIPNPQFELEALTYSYHVNLSASRIDEATQDLNQLMNLSKQHDLPNPTDYRHIAKINLLRLSYISNPAEKEKYFTEQIQNNFWSAFDAHKSRDTNKSFRAVNSILLKDFCMLLTMKIVQRLNDIRDTRPDETIYDYMQRQVSRVYKNGSSNYAHTLKIIKNLIENIKNQHMIVLAYHLFDSKPPQINISSDQFQVLFPDYDAFMAQPERPSSATFSRVTPQAFFKHRQDMSEPDNSSSAQDDFLLVY